MSDTKVWVRDSDMISAKSLLELLHESIDGMKKQVEENKNLTDIQKAAAAGAIEAVTDLHNLILTQINDARALEKFEGDDGRGGKFDA